MRPLLLATLIAGCGSPKTDDSGAAPPDSTIDDDGDGYAVEDDCDDQDGGVHPGAPEVCDGVDNDCDGVVDGPDAIGATSWYADTDGDGFGDQAAGSMGCEAPAGAVTDATDCDDSNAAVNPDATEVCDGVDDDCDGAVDDADPDVDPETMTGWYADSDEDGFGDPDTALWACVAPTGTVDDATDCDDIAADIHPGAPEVCGDEVDNDCDGIAPACGWAQASGAADASGYLVGIEADASLGIAAAGAQDVTGDGVPDLFVGASGATGEASSTGAAWVIPGPQAGRQDLSDAWTIALLGEAGDGGHAGAQVLGPGDVDGDGYNDLLVTDNAFDGSQGRVYLVSGPTTGSLDLASADTILDAAHGTLVTGGAMVSAGDLNGDGLPDVLVGSSGHSGYSTPQDVFLLSGDLSAMTDLSDASTVYLGDDDTKTAGGSLAGGGDGDGDGIPDVLIGHSSNDQATESAGAAWLVSGALTGQVSFVDEGVALWGEGWGDRAASSLAWIPDTNGDGYDDIAVGAYGVDTEGSNAGGVDVLLGPVTSSRSLSQADAWLGGTGSEDYAGLSAEAGDVDGDGRGDLLVGATGAEDAGRQGALFVVLGPITGSHILADADQILWGPEQSVSFGAQADLSPDMDGDGLPELFVGASSADDPYENCGGVYFFTSDSP